MVIPVNIEPKDYIKAYLSALNPIMKLKRREIEVLEGMIVVYANLKKEILEKRMTEKEVDKRMNDPIGRKVIADYIKMSRNSYNNHYSQLKEKGVIVNDRLPNFLRINPAKPDTEITYKINFLKKKPLNGTSSVAVTSSINTPGLSNGTTLEKTEVN